MPPTLKHLAEYTGLSIPTISEILNNKQRLYREDTRKRVMDAVEFAKDSPEPAPSELWTDVIVEGVPA